MGLFDEFICPDIACPACGAEMPEDWQSKALDCLFKIYRLGDELGLEGGLVLREGLVPVYNVCLRCEAYVTARAVVREGRFVGIDQVSARQDKMSVWDKDAVWDVGEDES